VPSSRARITSSSMAACSRTMSQTGPPSRISLTVSRFALSRKLNNSNARAVDFRRIPLGDVDLRREIRVSSASGVVHKRRVRGPVRRVYTGKIDGRKSDMTIALYQGINAEQVRYIPFFPPLNCVFTAHRRNGGRIFHDIQDFGESPRHSLDDSRNLESQASQLCSDFRCGGFGRYSWYYSPWWFVRLLVLMWHGK
jgi:hypothetical protein